MTKCPKVTFSYARVSFSRTLKDNLPTFASKNYRYATVIKSSFNPNSALPEGLDVSTGNPMYDKVLAFIKKDDSEAGLDVNTDFGPLNREFINFRKFSNFF